ncbi:hypothetical protein [Dyadobacter sp. CY347]|uniref:hypothetical protein n=1 Tax=Dyadobacter sp. CY347 TaxID=2909336 RepID=UPI001F491755|nr:hypothetical protein [Dyadobacter sp. CY347]MCF2489923.1 hypothetical protein [Dyadobacter sp. CY347]
MTTKKNGDSLAIDEITLRSFLESKPTGRIEKENIVFDETTHCLEITGITCIEDVFSIHADQIFKSINFVGCTLERIEFSKIKLLDDVEFRFTRCFIKELYIEGDKRMSLTVNDTRLDVLHVNETLNHLSIRNRSLELPEIKLLQLNGNYSEGQSIGIPRYELENLKVKTLDILLVSAFTFIKSSIIENFTCQPVESGSIWIQDGCSISTFQLHPLSGYVSVTKSRLGLIRIHTSGQNDAPGDDAALDVVDSTINELSIVNNAQIQSLRIDGVSVVNNLNLLHGSAKNVYIQCRHIDKFNIDIGWFRFDQMTV